MPKIITEKELMQREQCVLEVSCQIIKEQGFSGLTMDKIVARVPFSKGSLYKQFNSAQEVLLAITNSGAGYLIQFMEKALDFPGSSRERYLARACACFVYAQLYPIHYFSELEAISPMVREKATETRLSKGYELLRRFKELAERFVEEGVASGDLKLNSNSTATRIANTSWTSEFGLTSYSLAAYLQGDKFPADQRLKLEEELFWMVNVFLDGLDWKPLSGDHNYQKSWSEIKKTLFAEEISRIT